MKIDINCDMGEGFGAYKIGEDEKMIRYVTSANIACGFHAGDPMVMARTLQLAKSHRVAVGAHPGYPDLIGFGRRALETSPGEIKNYVLYQIGAIAALARASGLELQHVKPHGALYNHAAKNERAAVEITEAVKSFRSGPGPLCPCRIDVCRNGAGGGAESCPGGICRPGLYPRRPARPPQTAGSCYT